MLIAERRRVLAAMTIDDMMAADGFVVSADLMKTNRSSYRHNPPEFLPFIQEWLNLRQHYAADHNRLWIGKGGRPLSSDGIYAAMRSFTEREIGTALTPHRLPDLAATFSVEASPHLARHVRHILGHRHSSTTGEYPETAKQIEASRRLAEAMENVGPIIDSTLRSIRRSNGSPCSATNRVNFLQAPPAPMPIDMPPSKPPD